MPFNEPTNLTISVTQDDIDNATTGSTTNSLATALKRLANAYQLPGMSGDTQHQSCLFDAQLSPRLLNGVLISLVDTFVCTAVYSTDYPSALIIIAENLGVKPSAPYTVSLTKAQ